MLVKELLKAIEKENVKDLQLSDVEKDNVIEIEANDRTNWIEISPYSSNKEFKS